MTDVSPLPPRPSLDKPSAPKKSSWLAIFLAALFGIFCLVGISLLTLGYAAIIFAVIAAVFGIITFHYLTWGWWLSSIIKREKIEQKIED